MAGKHEGTVFVIGCFRELPAGPVGAYTFIARNRAASCMDRYDDKSPKGVLGMFRSRTRRGWGHAAISPRATLSGTAAKARWSAAARACATCAAGDSDPDWGNCGLWEREN